MSVCVMPFEEFEMLYNFYIPHFLLIWANMKNMNHLI